MYCTKKGESTKKERDIQFSQPTIRQKFTGQQLKQLRIITQKFHHSKEDLITKTGGMNDSLYPTMVEDDIHSSKASMQKRTNKHLQHLQTDQRESKLQRRINESHYQKLGVTGNMNIKITIEKIPQVQRDCKPSITVLKGRCVHITWAPTLSWFPSSIERLNNQKSKTTD